MTGQSEELPKRFGPFVLIRELGVGGMGAAYLALHAETDALLVVKRMHPELLNEETIFKRFVHEAEVAAHVQHPNVAALVAMGKIDQEPFLATEFVFGIQVSQVVERIETGLIDRIPLEVGLALAVDLASGVEAIHGACHRETGQPLALLHRDIGSRNVMLGFDGIIRIIDLGLGKSVLSDWQTASEVLAGSPDYMAPEQAMGARVDGRADVYSAAVTAWELLAGRKRIREDGVAARLAKAIQAQPEPLVPYREDVSPKLEAILKQAMNPDPELRTPTAQLFRRGLLDELSAIGRQASNIDVSRWLDSACATVIAREKRALSEARARGRALLVPDIARTVLLVGRPDTILRHRSTYEVYDEPDPAPAQKTATGSSTRRSERALSAEPASERSNAARAGRARVAEQEPRAVEHEPRSVDDLEAAEPTLERSSAPKSRVAGLLLGLVDPAHFRAQPRPVQVMLLSIAACTLLGIAIVTALIARPKSPEVQVTSIPQREVVRISDVPRSDPDPESPPPVEPKPKDEEDPKPVVQPGIEGPESLSKTPGTDEGTRALAPEAAERKADLIRRIRQLRRVRFDVGFQKRLTQLSTKLSRARNLRALEEIEAALLKLEKEG